MMICIVVKVNIDNWRIIYIPIGGPYLQATAVNVVKSPLNNGFHGWSECPYGGSLSIKNHEIPKLPFGIGGLKGYFWPS
jgi:hypothetical protein